MNRFISLAAAGAVTVSMLAGTAGAQNFAPNAFTDVPTNHANYEAIEHLRKNNVLKGYTDGTFKAERRISRAEFVTLITNPYILDTEQLNNCLTEELAEDDKTVFFSDVRRDMWYADEVCLAKIKKLIDGYPDGTFRPGRYVSFVEAAKIIAGTFSLQTNVEPTGEQWYRGYVEKLDELNAIPMSVSTFAEKLTRGEMVEILYRLKTSTTNKSSKTYGNLR